jgi:YHS domain-containing protein
MRIKSLFFAMFVCAASFGQGKVFKTDEGAIRGYDPVAYFTESKPVKGLKIYSHTWNGATWYFSSKKNQDLFMAHPQKYAPQFGGFCAYGVSRNYKVKTEPDAWTIVDGRLYLNYDTGVSEIWNKDRENYIKKGKENWVTLENKE